MRNGSAGSGTPGWRLDAYGTWTWDEPSLLERAGVGVGALRHGFGDGDPYAAARALAPVAAVPAARGAEPGPAGTPIFQALTEDRHRRATLHAVPEGGYDAGYAAGYEARERALPASGPSIPDPSPGPGPLPIQDAAGPVRARRGLADVPTVPPPPAAGDTPAAAPESPEDELRRRAERRRRPRSEPAGEAGGRHAMREQRSAGGRHAMH